MKRICMVALVGLTAWCFQLAGADGVEPKGDKYVVGSKTAAKEKKVDTLKVTARVLEIPGTFPPNDLYDYVYVMKYRVTKVLSGTCAEKEILVGHYNPLIARKNVKDKMNKFVDGDVEKFEVGATHTLVLVKPIDLVWGEALEDEYFDVDASEKYYAVKADVTK